MPKEEAWHRNLRHSRQTAKGILAATKLGLDIPEETVAAAKFVLIEHHATDADTMLSWAAEQKMQNCLMQNLMSSMINGNYQAMPNQQGMMPWGKGGNPGGEGGGKGGWKDGKGVAKVVGAKVAKQQRINRDLAADAEACTPKASVRHTSSRQIARIASCRDI